MRAADQTRFPVRPGFWVLPALYLSLSIAIAGLRRLLKVKLTHTVCHPCPLPPPRLPPPPAAGGEQACAA